MSERIKKMLFEQSLVASHAAWEAQQGRIDEAFDAWAEGYIAGLQERDWRGAWVASEIREKVLSGPVAPSMLPPTAKGPMDPANLKSPHPARERLR